MKFNRLIAIFTFIALFAISRSGQAPPPHCNEDVAVFCTSVGPTVKAKAGQGKCETYDNECLVQQSNCIRYRNGEPLLTLC